MLCIHLHKTLISHPSIISFYNLTDGKRKRVKKPKSQEGSEDESSAGELETDSQPQGSKKVSFTCPRNMEPKT